MRFVCLSALLLLGSSCVSGKKIRADTEVLQVDVERARRQGALQCAPQELATAEAHLDFARGELSQGSSFRASEHVQQADLASKRAWALIRDCGGKRGQKPGQVVVRVQQADGDGDNVPDREDLCPDQPEDRDGFEDADGCPEADNDRDGLLDGNDKCPLSAGPPTNNGCPEDKGKDRDLDGIADALDKCPEQAEDKDGFQDEDGCPEVDNDNDGILDGADKCPLLAGPLQLLGCPLMDKDNDGLTDDHDKCPEEPEDKDGFQDDDGCPDLDNDSDGVADLQDRCPLDPGVKEEQGCPKKYERVVVKRDRIEIKQQLNFRSGSARLTGRDSFATLDDVAQALTDASFIKKIRVEGHTDSVGSDTVNLRLSQQRADVVKSELIKRGIDPARMDSVGYGEGKPLSSNGTASGRAENRRTEFNIVEEQAPLPAPAPTPAPALP